MTIEEQALRYLSKVPPAVSGQRGHDQTFRAACVLIHGFAMTPDQAKPILLEYNRGCQPPWTERDIEHKLRDAERAHEPKGKGYLIQQQPKTVTYHYRGQDQPPRATYNAVIRRPVIEPEKTDAKPKRYSSADQVQLPKPMEDGTRQLLASAFLQGEGVRICIARTNDEGKEVPKDSGVTLSREEWLKKLDSNEGDPNRFLRSSDRNGIFVSVNPLKVGGSRDADVTAFRHCLLEFDEISHEEQWNLITQSKVPVTAVISSGGRSIHAWVRVDAKDRAEYDERVKLLYTHFAEYKPDEKNKNPSRFSRLPNCIRFDKRQELLALNIGAESFSEWQIQQEIDELGQEITVKDLLSFDSSNDPNSVLGQRWLCRGTSCLWVGQSGIGKSSLSMQQAILWGMGQPSFGITPAKPLRSLFIQAENDLGDVAEMFQGVWLGMNLPGPEKPEVIAQIQKNVIMRKVTTQTGQVFCQSLRRLIDRYKPDLVWIDPLLSYIGDDISKQSVCSTFLRNWMNPISEATGVIWMILHHTGKPPKDPKSKTHWNHTDYSYEGTGSAELTNWARAVCVLRRRDANLFELILAKREQRAQAKSLDGSLTTRIWLRHSEKGICWEQVQEPDEKDETPQKEKQSGGSSKHKSPAVAAREFDYGEFIKNIDGEFFTASQLVDRAAKISGLGKTTVWNRVFPTLKTKLKWDESTKSYSAPSDNEPF